MASSRNYAHECSACKGHGWIELTGVYLKTLETVERITKKKKSAFIVANQDAEQFGCTPTALNNRLAKLEQHGYLFSQRFGRQRRFFLKD